MCVAGPEVEKLASTGQCQTPHVTRPSTPTPTEVRADPSQKSAIIDATKAAHVHSFLDGIGVDTTALLTPDVTSTTNFMDSLNFAAREYGTYATHLAVYKQKSTFSWGKSKLHCQLESVKQSTADLKTKLADIASIELDVPELHAKIHRANTKLTALTQAAILLSTLASLTTIAGLSLRQRVCEMNIAEKKKVYADKSDYVTMKCLVNTDTTWADAVGKLDLCVQYTPLSYEQLCAVPMLFEQQAEPGCCWVFGSTADRDRHTRLVHRQKKDSRKRGSNSDSDSAPPAKKAKVYTTCKECDKTFPSAHYLNKHKKETEHKNKK